LEPAAQSPKDSSDILSSACQSQRKLSVLDRRLRFLISSVAATEIAVPELPERSSYL
jgi:hypothetical protein